MKQMNRSRTLRVLVGMVAVVALVFVVVGVYGRYVYGKSGDGKATATEFYFDSNYLGASGTAFTLPGSQTTFAFELRNWPDNLRYSDEDIRYEVFVDGSSVMTGTIPGGEQNTVTVEVDLPNAEPGKSYEIQVVGDAGFVKSLYATVNLQKPGAEAYWHLDTSNLYYVTVTVWTANCSGPVTVSVPNTLIPDNTDPAMKDLATGDPVNHDGLEIYSSYSYRFFKQNVSDVFSSANFTVKVGGKTATHVLSLP